MTGYVAWKEGRAPHYSAVSAERRFYTALYSSAHKNAKHRGISWDLDREAFDRLVERAGGACEVTGVPFSLILPKGSRRRPWAPSLDRVDSKKGYTVPNVRLVCIAANLAMNEWGDSVLRQMAESMIGGAA